MSRSAKSRRFVPRLLELESRDVPAGGVTVSLLGDQLLMVGDAADNHLTLRGLGAGIVEIRGLETTLNGGDAALTFSGVRRVRVDAADGNDTVTGMNLELGWVEVFAGAGDDGIGLTNTTGTEDGLHFLILGDGSPSSPPSVNGSDTITLSGTRQQGENLTLFIGTDDYGADGGATQDTVSITDTRVSTDSKVGTALFVFIDGTASSSPGPGDRYTIEQVEVDAVFGATEPWLLSSAWSLTIFGSAGDDQFRLSDLSLSGQSTQASMLSDIGLYGADGHDAIDLRNLKAVQTSSPLAGLLNQVDLILDAEHVRLRDVSQQAGVQIDEFSQSLNSVSVTAVESDLRNVAITSSTGAANLILNAPFGPEPSDVSLSLANVTVRGGNAFSQSSFTDIFTGEGDDALWVANCNLGAVAIDLGEGDDTVWMVNATLDAPFAGLGFLSGIVTGGGNDVVTLSHCTAPTLLIDGGDGNDAVSLAHCSVVDLIIEAGWGDDSVSLARNVLGTAHVWGGDGSDVLDLFKNLGQVESDGFEH